MSLIEQREALLSEYTTYLDNAGVTFSAQKSAEFQARIAKLDLKISEERTSQVVDKSHRFGNIPGAIPTPIIQAESAVTPEVAAKQTRAYDAYLRNGIQAVRQNEELRTYAPLSVGSEALGQYLVPVTTAPEIETKIKAVGQILSVMRYLNSGTGETINWPTVDDTAEKGEFILENGAVSQSNPVFGHVPLSSFQWSSKQVLVPLSLIQDTRFDLVSHLNQCFALRAARGYSSRAVTDATDGLLNIAGTGSLTAASPTAVDYNEALNLQSKLDLGYIMNSTYVMSFATYLAYRALKTSTGAPLWPVEDYSKGMLHGRPFVFCQDMPSSGTTGNQYLALGDFSHWIYRAAGPMSVFRFSELFMSNLQHAFQSFQRVSFKCLQPSAFAILKAA
jgi:HK97 family phage major capsid protein